MKILITAPYHQKAQLYLKRIAEEIVYRPWKTNGRAYSEDELIALMRETKPDALITEHDEVTEKLIRLFPNLEFIGVCRGTPSNVSMEAASRYGIPVFFTPARNAQAVTEMFISNLIFFYRPTLAGMEWLRKGEWGEGAHTSYLQFKGNELAGKTVGLVGFGAIGQKIGRILKCFPTSVQFYDPYIESSDPAFKKQELEAVFATSDVVSIHLPVNASTVGMIDKKLFDLMKPDSIFVNTARAAVVKREDLLCALKTGKIRGAILDVFDHEPPDEIDNQIIHLPNVMATPHIAGATYEVEDHHAEIMNNALVQWFESHKKEGHLIVNKEAI